MSFKDSENLFNNIKCKGKYVVIFKLQDLYKNILENCEDFIMCGKIVYSNKWSAHPFIKKEIYKDEREFRFLFNSMFEYTDYKIQPLIPLLFLNIDTFSLESLSKDIENIKEIKEKINEFRRIRKN